MIHKNWQAIMAIENVQLRHLLMLVPVYQEIEFIQHVMTAFPDCLSDGEPVDVRVPLSAVQYFFRDHPALHVFNDDACEYSGPVFDSVLCDIFGFDCLEVCPENEEVVASAAKAGQTDTAADPLEEAKIVGQGCGVMFSDLNAFWDTFGMHHAKHSAVFPFLLARVQVDGAFYWATGANLLVPVSQIDVNA